MMRKPSLRYITVHCSATQAAMDIGVDEIRQWHLARGWRDIGYHFVIRRCGVVELGRPLSKMGAHVRGHNKGNIGICLIGGTDKALQAQDNFTLAQRKALFGLIAQLQHQFEIKDEDVRGHNGWDSSKACPVMVINY